MDYFQWKKNLMSKNDFWTFLIIFRHEIFFGPKKKVSILFGGFHHIAWFFYGLNLRDLHQAFGIWCEIGISLRLTHLDWPRSKKTGKNQKTPIPATFSCFEGFKPSKQLQTSFWPSLTAFRSQNFGLRQFSQFSLSLLKMEKFSKMAIWGPNLG